MKNILSLSDLESYFNGKKTFSYNFKGKTKDIWVNKEKSETYVEPDFSLVAEMSNCTNLNEAQIILVVAVGATGKTELTKRLSYDLGFPVVNLGHTKVVASNSLTGLIFKHLRPMDGGAWLQDIVSGKTGIIIDALDEGYQKTNTQGFFDFLDDVAANVSTNSCSFIMLGRTNAIELTSLYLDDKDVKVAVLQIEPFSSIKAKEFIDKQVSLSHNNQYMETYIETRDYVLDSLGDFFKTDSSYNEDQRYRFIGYAPVLLAISEFLKPEKVGNYKAVYEDLKSNKNKSISLILDVVNRILIRDKKNKIVPNLIEDIVKSRDAEFKQKAITEAYTPEEQCARILYILLGEQFPYRPIEDDDFDVKYRKGLETWMVEHPFLKDRNPANVVFECYILAKLVVNNKYKEAVYEYMRTRRVNSFMLFYLYIELNKNEQIDAEVIPYLYNSLKTLDSKELNYSLEIESSDKVIEEPLSYDVSFVPSDSKQKEYEFTTYLNGPMVWHGPISDITIDISNDFVMEDERIDMFVPSYINCKNLVVKSSELNYSNRGRLNNIIIEAEHIISETSTGIVPHIKGVGCNKDALSFICFDRLPYPYCDYQKKKSEEDVEMSSEMVEAYKKMRRTLIMFRSHSKGQLAKHHEKIDNRIGNTLIGKAVIDALLKKHIIYQEEHVYVIDNDSMDNYLGVKFDGIRNSTITKPMLQFLDDIVKNMKVK